MISDSCVYDVCFTCKSLIDIELTIDPAQGEFWEYDFLIPYGMWHSEKMIAQFCWGFKELWALYTLPPQKMPFSVYLTLKHQCI